MDPHRTTGVHSFADDSTWFPEAQTSLELLGEGDEVQQRDRVLFHLGEKAYIKTWPVLHTLTYWKLSLDNSWAF